MPGARPAILTRAVTNPANCPDAVPTDGVALSHMLPSEVEAPLSNATIGALLVFTESVCADGLGPLAVAMNSSATGNGSGTGSVVSLARSNTTITYTT